MAAAVGDMAQDLRRGAANLLVGCAGAKPGARLLILEEDPALGHYAAGLGAALAAVAGDLGLTVSRRDIGFSPGADDPPAAVLAAIAAADHIVYLARLGDQTRFRPLPGAARSVVCYALGPAALAGPFGTLPHAALVALKQAIDAAMQASGHIRVTCPLGSDFAGRIAPSPGGLADVGIRRFPMSVFAPVPMAGFAGRVALARFLVGTGSLYYQPFLHPIDGVVTVRFAGNRVLGHDGPPAAVAGVRAHVARVAAMFGLDGDFVHSWHAGIHPGCAYAGAAADNPGRWSGSAFGNPRLLHVHSCGTYAPGEICWNLLDPTIALDGVALWQDGRLHPRRIPGGAAVLDACPELAAQFASPQTAVGIA